MYATTELYVCFEPEFLNSQVLVRALSVAKIDRLPQATAEVPVPEMRVFFPPRSCRELSLLHATLADLTSSLPLILRS